MNFRSLVLLLLSLKNGVCTSPAQFFFYLSALFCGAFTLRTRVQRADKMEYDQDESDRLLYFYAFQYGLYMALFFLNCFADSSESKVSHFDNVFFQKDSYFENNLKTLGAIQQIEHDSSTFFHNHLGVRLGEYCSIPSLLERCILFIHYVGISFSLSQQLPSIVP